MANPYNFSKLDKRLAVLEATSKLTQQLNQKDHEDMKVTLNKLVENTSNTKIKVASLAAVVSIIVTLMVAFLSTNAFGRAQMELTHPYSVSVQGTGLCSGGVVRSPEGRPYVLTAGHCVRGLGDLVIVTGTGWVSPMIVVAASYKANTWDTPDWALLSGNTYGVTGFEIDARDYIIPFNSIYSSIYAVVPCAIIGMDGLYFLSLSESRPGESGSLLLSPDGKVLGVLNATYSDKPAMISTPAKYVSFPQDIPVK